MRRNYFILGNIILISVFLGGCNSSGNKSINALEEVQKTKIGNRPMPKLSGNSAEKSSSIKIGLITSESGQLSPWGIELRKAVRLAVNKFNKNNAVKNKKIELLIEDAASRPDQARTAAEKLLSKGCIGLIGEITSGNTAQIAMTAYEKGVPLVIVSATGNDLTHIGTNIFRVCYTDDFQGPAMAKFALKELNLQNVAIFTDKEQPYSVGLSNGFRKYFESQGGKIVAEQFYSTGQTQFSAQLTNVKSKNPDGLFIGGYFPEVGPLIRQARNLGIDVYALGGDGWDNEEIFNSGGKAILGGYHCTHFCHGDKRPIVAQFVSSWKKLYHSDFKTITAVLGYDGAMIMLNAIKRCDKLDSSNLIKQIELTENYDGLTGAISFKGNKGEPNKPIKIVCMTSKGRIIQKEYTYDDIKNKKQ